MNAFSPPRCRARGRVRLRRLSQLAALAGLASAAGFVTAVLIDGACAPGLHAYAAYLGAASRLSPPPPHEVRT